MKMSEDDAKNKSKEITIDVFRLSMSATRSIKSRINNKNFPGLKDETKENNENKNENKDNKNKENNKDKETLKEYSNQ